MMERMVLSSQMTKICGKVIGILVDKMTGTVAEKNIIVDTQTTPITNLVNSAASTTRSAGRNISAIPIDAALAASIASGNCNSHVKG